jgi:hypothetical protein
MIGEVFAVELRFPDPAEVARQRAAEFQRLDAEARWREIAALMAFGWATVRSSPDREAIEKRMEEQEKQWQQFQRELFASHGK